MPSEGSSSKPALKGKIDDCLRSILDGLTKSGPSHLPGSTVDDLAKRDPLFFLIAGEASGDLLGARLMKALKAKLGGRARFMGVGGPRMQAEGIELLFPHTEIMHFGIVEVLKHIPRLLRRIRETANAVVEAKPAALITIDSPDFSFRVAKRVRKRAGDKIRLIHYVAPTVWAWRPGRAKKIAKFLDLLLAVLPFEPPYFESEGLP
ncbi:MAG: hypothetical protein PHE27_07195, partial [Alphaproteobacteria bacterium]|nr:hypothetical protein [Alphaproteobacteria bacterium]